MPESDLIFSDIQLGDGLSFEIFATAPVNVPVIFCTAYDEYALNAFQANGIDYILKPFTTDSVAAAIKKYLNFREKIVGDTLRYKTLEDLFRTPKTTETSSILVYQKDQILPIGIDQSAFFYLKRGAVFLTTFNKEQYLVNKSLDELGDQIGPSFFRASRQFLIHRKAVTLSNQDLHHLAPTLLNNPTTSPCPFLSAHAIGLAQSAPANSWSAPRSSRNRTISVCPHRAASPNGVDSYASSITSIFAPYRNNSSAL